MMMNKRGMQTVKYIMMVVVMCMALTTSKMVAFAGNINGNEARVISAASGTFTYEGKQYKAGSSYLNSLVSYLSGDDVDLTAEQADEAISMMYANVAQGVAEGYIYEIGAGEDITTEQAATEDDWADAETDGENDKRGAGQKEEDDSASTNGAEDSTTESLKQQTQNELNVWEVMSNPTENKNKLKERPKKEEASASVELDVEGIVVTTKNHKAISISKKKPIISHIIVVILMTIADVMLGITVICGVILFVKKCMSFKKTKGRKARPGHSKRRKIRRYTRTVLTVTTSVALIGVALLLGVHISLFNNDAIMQNMQRSGYFRYAYSQYIAEQAQDKDSELQTYDAYLFTIKQNSLKVLEGNLDSIIPDSNVAPYIYNLKVSFGEIYVKVGISLILTVICGVFLMVFMDQRRERGVKHTAVSVLSASGVMAVVTLIMLMYKPYTLLYIEPDYLYLFLMECIQRCVTVLTSITAFEVVLGMLLVGIYKTMVNKS